jgi:hypothetical protein
MIDDGFRQTVYRQQMLKFAVFIELWIMHDR